MKIQCLPAAAIALLLFLSAAHANPHGTCADPTRFHAAVEILNGPDASAHKDAAVDALLHLRAKYRPIFEFGSLDHPTFDGAHMAEYNAAILGINGRDLAGALPDVEVARDLLTGMGVTSDARIAWYQNHLVCLADLLKVYPAKKAEAAITG